MIRDNAFERAMATVLVHEGGYVHDPDDVGGETKFGLSKRTYPNVDVANLTEEQAKDIYYNDFWQKYGYHHITDYELAGKVFDLAVNVGPTWAHKLLQRALRAAGQEIVEDGQLGPQTLKAINTVDLDHVCIALKSESAGYYRTLAATKPTQTKFLNGWLKRAYA